MNDTRLPLNSKNLFQSASAKFTAFCIIITLVALGLLMVRAPQALDHALHIGYEYGLGVVSVLSVLFISHFIISFVIQIRQSRTDKAPDRARWYKSYFSNTRWKDISAASVALIVTTTSFTVHKGAVIGAMGYDYDEKFISWDRALFGGIDPWRITHSIFSTPAATGWIDFLYHPAFLPMLIGYLLCIPVRGKAELRYTYMVSYLASFVVIGMLMAASLPSAGPLFDGVLFGDGATFAPLVNRLNTQHLASDAQTSNAIREYLLTLHQRGNIKMGAGISAMPSMHIVLAFLWVFPSWHINRTLGVAMTIYALVIWIGSVHLGWHYFVDGLVGLIVVAIIWRAVGQSMGLYQRVR